MAEATHHRADETVTAFFETRTGATEALDRLRREGIPVDEARLHDGDAETADEAGREDRHKGFWQSLGDLFLPHEDRGTYAEALTRGGTLLSLPVSAADRERAVALLDDAGTLDIDERQAHWKSEGWGGPLASPTLGDTAYAVPRDDAAMRSGISGIGAHAAGTPPARFARRNEDLPGRRVRSYRLDRDEPGASEVEVETGRSGAALDGSGAIRRSL